jgi:hypothetical protein
VGDSKLMVDPSTALSRAIRWRAFASLSVSSTGGGLTLQSWMRTTEYIDQDMTYLIFGGGFLSRDIKGLLLVESRRNAVKLHFNTAFSITRVYTCVLKRRAVRRDLKKRRRWPRCCENSPGICETILESRHRSLSRPHFHHPSRSKS